MTYTKLGRSGLIVSRLCLGTMNFGEFTSKQDAFRIMDQALDAGITFFDTANIYGGRENPGATERLIGEWFAQGGNRRERVVLGTKLYNPMREAVDGPNDVGGLSAYKIKREIDRSLKRLGTDHVELYQMHHIDRHARWEELWGAFEDLVAAGKIVYVGSSNFAGWHLAVAQAAAARRGFLGLVSEQTKYNLVCREPELELLPSAEFHGIGVLPWSPLGGGVLAARGSTASQDAAGTRRARPMVQERYAAYAEQIERYAAVCGELNAHPASVAVAWLLANPAVTAPVVGPRTPEHLRIALAALEIELNGEVMRRIEEIFPGPGRPAPEAYAW